MANLPEGFELYEPETETPQMASPPAGLPEGFELYEQEQPIQPTAQAQEQPPEPLSTKDVIDRLGFKGISSAIEQTVAGAFRNTWKPEQRELEDIPEIEKLPVIDYAPNLGYEAKSGIFLSDDPYEKVRILSKNKPGTSFREDQEGNLIAKVDGVEYAVQKPYLELSDAKKFVAENVIFGPASKAKSVIVAIAGSGLTQASLEAIKEQTGGFFNDQEVKIAAAFGGLGKSVENIISAIDNFRRAGKIPEETQKLLDLAKQKNLDILTTDVVEPEQLSGKLARSVGESIPFAGTGGKRAEQQAIRERMANEFSENVGDAQYDQVVQGLKDKESRIIKAAGNRMGRIGDDMQEVGDIPTINIRKSFDDHLEWSENPRNVSDEGLDREVRVFQEAIEAGQSFKELDRLRTNFRIRVKGERPLLPDTTDRQVTAMYNAMTEDMLESIRKNPKLGQREAERFEKAKGIHAREVDNIKNSKINNILSKGDITPEKARGMIFGEESEMESLYRRLDDKGRSAARATILAEVIKDASKGTDGLTPTHLATQLRKKSPQIDAFFRGADKDQLKGLQLLLDKTRRAQESSVATPTGQQLIPFLTGGAVYGDPVATILGGGSIGSMARIYESKPVRNALIRINTVKGDRRDKAFRQAAEEIQKAVQASKSATSETISELME